MHYHSFSKILLLTHDQFKYSLFYWERYVHGLLVDDGDTVILYVYICYFLKGLNVDFNDGNGYNNDRNLKLAFKTINNYFRSDENVDTPYYF